MGKALAFLLFLSIQLAAHGLLVVLLWLGLGRLLKKAGRPIRGLLAVVILGEQLLFGLLAFHPVVWCPAEWQDQYTAEHRDMMRELVPSVLDDLSTPVFVKVRSCGTQSLSVEVYSFVSSYRTFLYRNAYSGGGGKQSLLPFDHGWIK